MGNEKDKSIKKRRIEILGMLLERPYTYDELAVLYGQSIRTIKGDIKALQDSGCNILRHEKGVGYIIPEDSKSVCKRLLDGKDENIIYKRTTKNNVDKSIVLLLLQRSMRGLSLDEITDGYYLLSDPRFFDAEYMEDGIPFRETKEYSNEKRSLKNILDNLIEDGIIEYNSNEKKYIVSETENSKIILNMSVDDVESYLYAIKAFGSTYTFKDKLIEIEKRLSAYINDTDLSDSDDYIVVGNKTNSNPNIIRKIEMFETVPYDKYAIKISVKGKCLIVKIGMIVYSVDKDKLYIIGKVKKEKYKIIDVEDISGEIEAVKDQKNDLYKNEEYLMIYNEMFSVSAEPLEHVVVEVDDYGNIKKKFENLIVRRNRGVNSSHNKGAKISVVSDGKFVYEDDIRGLSDFAKYLRKFGRSIHVIAPDRLKNMMINDINRSIENYRNEGLYE